VASIETPWCLFGMLLGAEVSHFPLGGCLPFPPLKPKAPRKKVFARVGPLLKGTSRCRGSSFLSLPF